MQGEPTPTAAGDPALVVTLTVTLTSNGAPDRMHIDANMQADGAQDLVERVLAHEPRIHPFVDAFRDAVLLALGGDRRPGPSTREAVTFEPYRRGGR